MTRVEGVDRRPLDRGLGRRQPALQALPEVLRRPYLCVRQVGDENLPAPPRAGPPNVGHRGPWVAVLDGVIAQVGPFPAQQQIHHQPAFVESQVLGSAGDVLPDQRPCAIAPDDVPCRQRLMAVSVAAADRDQFPILRDRRHLGVQSNVDVRHGAEAIAQDRLQVRLVEAVARIPALRTDLLWPRPVEQEPAGGIDEPHARIDSRHRGHPVRDTERLKDAHHLAVEVDGTRQAQDLPLPFQHRDPQPAQPRQAGKHGAGRAETDDGDVVGPPAVARHAGVQTGLRPLSAPHSHGQSVGGGACRPFLATPSLNSR